MGIPERWKGRATLRADVADRLDDLEPLFERRGVILAYLFGSLARGEPAEDVDLAVLQENADGLDIWSDIPERVSRGTRPTVILKREIIEERLKPLDEVATEIERHLGATGEELAADVVIGWLESTAGA